MSKDKRIILYEAALSLIEEKHDMSNIKVADIAAKADIGKGTVYEYFKSKEQLMAESIIYFVKKDMISLEKTINNNENFKEIFMSTLRNVSNTMTTSRTFFQYIMFNECNFSLTKAIQGVMEEHFENMKRKYMCLFEKIIDIAVAQKVLKQKPDKLSWFIAISNSITCMVTVKHGIEEFNELTEEKAIEKAYNMFIKLLN